MVRLNLNEITQNMTKNGGTNSVYIVTGRKGRVTGIIAGVTGFLAGVTNPIAGVTYSIVENNGPGNAYNGHGNRYNRPSNDNNEHGNGYNGLGNGRKSEQKTVGATRWVARKTGQPPVDPYVRNNTKREERCLS